MYRLKTYPDDILCVNCHLKVHAIQWSQCTFATATAAAISLNTTGTQLLLFRRYGNGYVPS